MANKNNYFNISQPQIPIFEGENYGLWSIKMKTLFLLQELSNFMENGYTKRTHLVSHKSEDMN